MRRISRQLSIRNIIKSPVRSISLILLAALLAFSICAGTLIIFSLNSGIDALEARLGADIIVVPEESYESMDIEGILLEGNNGYFYMDNGKTSEVGKLDGVSEVSEQLYLTSMSSGCCSFPVQIVGYDPETDFTITPWISQSKGAYPTDKEVVVGNNINANVGDTLTFYDVDVRVIAKLDKTGTALDSTVYANKNTLKVLIQSSIDKKLNLFEDIQVDEIASCILINVSEDAEISDVLTAINRDVDGVKAIRTKAMISGISENLVGLSRIIITLVAAIWVIAFVIMITAFVITVNARKREFATLRMLGATRVKLAKVVIKEGIVLCLIGNVVGIALSLLVMIPFNTVIRNILSLPYLLPAVETVLVIAVLTLLVSCISGTISTFASAYKISRIDSAIIMREGI